MPRNPLIVEHQVVGGKWRVGGYSTTAFTPQKSLRNFSPLSENSEDWLMDSRDITYGTTDEW